MGSGEKGNCCIHFQTCEPWPFACGRAVAWRSPAGLVAFLGTNSQKFSCNWLALQTGLRFSPDPPLSTARRGSPCCTGIWLFSHSGQDRSPLPLQIWDHWPVTSLYFGQNTRPGVAPTPCKPGIRSRTVPESALIPLPERFYEMTQTSYKQV